MNNFIDSIRNFLFILFLLTLLGYGFWSISNKTFDRSEAYKKAKEAGCMVYERYEGPDVPVIDLKEGDAWGCDEYYEADDFLFGPMDFAIFIILIVVAGTPIVIFTFLGIDNWADSRKYKSDPNKKVFGDITVSDQRVTLDKYSFDDDVKFRCDNVRDIVKKKVICKDDYGMWFGDFARGYISSYPKHSNYMSKQEAISCLKFAIDTIPLIYKTPKAKELGAKKIKMFQKYIDKLEKL